MNKKLAIDLNPNWVSWALIGLVIFVPISSTIRGVFLAASLALILLTPENRRLLLPIFKTPLAWFAVGIFILAGLGCFWGQALSPEKMMVLGKYTKFLFFPILMAGFISKAIREKALNAYLIAMLGITLLSFMKWFGVLHWRNEGDPSDLFYNHIITGLMINYAAYLAIWLCTSHWQKTGGHKYFYGALFVLFSVQILFVGTGRMSYITYTILMGVFLLQALHWRKALIGLLALTAVLGVVFYQSPVVQEGFSRVMHDVRSYHHHDKDTSVGYRLQFHDFSKVLFERHPLIGNGTGGFIHGFSVEKPTPSWHGDLAEPHSQYWLILSEFGLLGVLIWGLFIGFLAITISQLKEMRIPAVGLFLALLVGCFTDSLFFYSMTGLFFIIMMSLCLGEAVEPSRE